MTSDHSSDWRATSLAVALAAYAALQPQLTRGQDSARPFAAVVDATEAAAEAARRLSAGGSFKSWGDGRLLRYCDFEMAVRDDLYYLVVERGRQDEEPTPLDDHLRLVLCDGRSIFVNRFNDRLRPLGREMDVYDANLGDPGRATGTSLNPVELLQGMVGDPVQYAANAVLRETRPNGNLVFILDNGGAWIGEIEASPAAGMNVIRYETRAKEGDRGVGRFEAEWRQTEGHWHVSRLTRLTEPPGPAGTGLKEEVVLKDVRFDAPPAEAFTFGTLAPLERQRVIDRRRDFEVRARTVTRLTDDDLMGDPEEVVRRLPMRF